MVARNYGRNPSPRRGLGWPLLALAASTETDASGIGSAVDGGDGSITITVDGSAAMSDPAAGYIRSWPLVDPAGQPLGASALGPLLSAVRVVTAPANESDLVCIVGFAAGATLASGHVGAGLHYDGAAGAELYTDVSGTGSSGTPTASSAGARMTLQMRAHTSADPPAVLARGFAALTTSAGVRLDDSTMSVSGAFDSDDDIHFFVAVFTSTQTDTETSITIVPSYCVGPVLSSVLP